ncbi:DUF58 domain-containing protein [Gulosibacter faecalis]|uniref:DUF58 domain-containing protein n=1 Tax=Gulosibacter faecalis TaxID=272240 RepID=A0ABW5UXI1_9MICO|nr:DUF58 domain-containing protein [Gulosibacter faecalis]
MTPLESSGIKPVPLRPTARAWWLLGSGVVLALLGDLLDVPPLRWSGIAIAVLPVLMLLARLFVRPRLEVERTVYPTTVAAGDRLRVVAEVRNLSIFGVEPGSYLDIVTGADRAHVGGVLPAIASRLHPREGRRRRRIAYGLDRMRRGIRQVGPLLIENSDGLGLTRRVVRIGGPEEIEVWPHIHDVSQLDVPVLRSGDEVEVSLGRGGEADDVITREYRRGDPLRRVHWKATARAGELRVRQEEHHSEAVAEVVLGTAPSREGWFDDAFDLCVSVAASVAVRLHSLGFDTETSATHLAPDLEGHELDRLQVSASESLEPLMRRLMLIQPSPDGTEADIEGLADTILRVGSGPLIYVGKASDPGAARLSVVGEPAIAILVANPGERPAAIEAYVRAGWRVVVMDAGARDPWSSVRVLGEAA